MMNYEKGKQRMLIHYCGFYRLSAYAVIISMMSSQQPLVCLRSQIHTSQLKSLLSLLHGLHDEGFQLFSQFGVVLNNLLAGIATLPQLTVIVAEP